MSRPGRRFVLLGLGRALLLLYLLVDVVLPETQPGSQFGQFKRDSQGARLVQGIQVLDQGVENLFGYLLPDIRVPPAAYLGGDMHEGIVRVGIRDQVIVTTDRAETDTAQGKHAGFHGAFVQGTEQPVQVQVVFEIG